VFMFMVVCVLCVLVMIVLGVVCRCLASVSGANTKHKD
jgi:hypothetical protein